MNQNQLMQIRYFHLKRKLLNINFCPLKNLILLSFLICTCSLKAQNLLIKRNILNTHPSFTENGNPIITIILSSIILFLLVASFLFLRRRNIPLLRIMHNPFKLELKADENIPEDKSYDDEAEKPPTKYSVTISDDTVAVILKKIHKFESTEKFLRKDINLTWLSSHLNTNTKYLSEVIKFHSNKNFNNYINGLRIDYITKKLYEDPVYKEYKISYLSKECGFASPQVFVIAFKKEKNVTPSFFIEQLKNESDQPS